MGVKIKKSRENIDIHFLLYFANNCNERKNSNIGKNNDNKNKNGNNDIDNYNDIKNNYTTKLK